MIRHQRSAQNAINKITVMQAPHTDKVGELRRIRDYANFWIEHIENMTPEYVELLQIHEIATKEGK